MADAEALIAGVVLRDDEGRYLLVQERKILAAGLWSFTGGHVDKGETAQQAAIREAREEVGYDVELVSPEPIHIGFIPKVQHEYYAFLGKITGGTLDIDFDELLDARWLDLDTIQELNEAGKIRDPLVMEAILKTEAHENPGH